MRWLCPEVIQASAMDCGPASLSALLLGMGIHASYGRLREVCQTGVDGTSIDALEEVACALGLPCEQVIVAPDHALLASAQSLPCIGVFVVGGGSTHFSVIWRRHGPWVQVMDPAVGRRWVRHRELLDELMVHDMVVPEAAWRSHAGSGEFVDGLVCRMKALSLPDCSSLVARALGDSGALGLAVLDAAVRFAASLVDAGAVGRGGEAGALVAACIAAEEAAVGEQGATIPLEHWHARPIGEVDGVASVHLRGVVLARAVPNATAEEIPTLDGAHDELDDAPLRRVTASPPPRPLRRVWSMLGARGRAITIAALVAAMTVALLPVGQALLLRAFVDAGPLLAVGQQRLIFATAIALFLAASLLIEIPTRALAHRVGRAVELRLRMALLTALPRMEDAYFSSRLTSDLATRGHVLHRVRDLAAVGTTLLRSVVRVIAVVAAIAWIDPTSGGLAAIGVGLALLLSLALVPAMNERDLEERSHRGAISSFYLDALLGVLPIRSHGAQRSVTREHTTRLGRWESSALASARLRVGAELAVGLVAWGIPCVVVYRYCQGHLHGGALLLLVYWAMQLPTLVGAVVEALSGYPAVRSNLLRLLEPLDSPLAPVCPQAGGGAALARGDAGVALHWDGVEVRKGGHTILRVPNLRIAAGEHVAVVGPSGAGKSTLLGSLMGWDRAARGRICADGEALDPDTLARLREQTAWVEPSTALWNRSLLANLEYGASRSLASAGEVIDLADLGRVLERLDGGLMAQLGEAGGLVSGGEGQRVRLGRGLMRADARLVVVDEAFRGLDREARARLLADARRHWSSATLLCATHDVTHAREFSRVLVVADGLVVEDGAPDELLADPHSRFAALVAAEAATQAQLGDQSRWTPVWMRAGRVEAG